jgi:serine/threonine protein kinase
MQMPFQPGAHVGGCRIVRLVGSGDVAQVFEVIDSRNVRRALKIIDRELPLAAAPQNRLAFGGEATVMVEHVNVVRLHDIGIHCGRVYLVLDFADGSDLRKVLEEAGGALPPLRALSLVLHACDGIGAVHAQQIIHRDIKPENILVSGNPEVAKVTGFGSAKLPGWGVTTTTTQRTGSARYTAPEFLRARTATTKMDVYSLAVILYEAIVGKNPFAGPEAPLFDIVEAHLTVVPQPLAAAMGERWRNLPDLERGVLSALSEVLAWALAKDVGARCTLAEFVEKLRLAQGNLLVQKRQAVRSLPLPNRGPALAPTEQAMAAWRDDSSAALPGVVVVRPDVAPYGATPLPGASRPIPPRFVQGGQAEARRDSDAGREAVLPPPSSEPATVPVPLAAVPTTALGTQLMAAAPPPLQEARPVPLRTERMATAGVQPPAPVAATPPLGSALPMPAERRSTGIPVESAVTRPAKATRMGLVLVVAGLLITVGLAVVGWVIFGGALSGPDRPPVPAAPTPPSASASSTARAPTAPPTATATSPAPSGRRGPPLMPTPSSRPK